MFVEFFATASGPAIELARAQGEPGILNRFKRRSPGPNRLPGRSNRGGAVAIPGSRKLIIEHPAALGFFVDFDLQIQEKAFEV